MRVRLVYAKIPWPLSVMIMRSAVRISVLGLELNFLYLESTLENVEGQEPECHLCGTFSPSQRLGEQKNAPLNVFPSGAQQRAVVGT